MPGSIAPALSEPLRSTPGSRAGKRFGWVLWGVGVALMPLGALLVPHDGSPIGLANFLPGLLGVQVWTVWAAGYAAMFAGMLLLRASALRTVVVAQLIGGTLCAVLTTATPSTDPFAYFLYGRMQAGGYDPWHPPRVDPADEYAVQTRTVLKDPTIAAVYGPAFIAIETALARLVPHASFAAAVWTHRALSLTAACLVTMLLRGPRIALWGLNPLVMISFAVAGHNDALMLLFVAAALRARSAWLAGGAIGIAATIKLPAAGVLFFVSDRPRKIAAALGIAALMFLAFPHALAQTPFVTQSEFQGNSPAGAFLRVLSKHHVRFASIVAPAIASAIVAFITFFRGWSVSRRNAAGACAFALLATSVYIQSWYFTWPLFCAAWVSRKLRFLIVAASGLAWMLDFGITTTLPLHLPSFGFWIPLVAIALVLFVVPLPPVRSWFSSQDAMSGHL